jgi:hypothetical protein
MGKKNNELRKLRSRLQQLRDKRRALEQQAKQEKDASKRGYMKYVLISDIDDRIFDVELALHEYQK